MSTPEPENPFRSPENHVRKFKVTSDPSIEFEPHLRPVEETLDSPKHESIWHEPTLAGGCFPTGQSKPQQTSDGKPLQYALAGLLLIFVFGILLAWLTG